MPDFTAKPTSPFSLRLSAEERARLERDAAGMSLGAYIRWRVFDPASPPPKSRGKFPVRDHAALSRLLGQLGASRLASNLNQLAHAANSGSFPVTPQTEAALRRSLSEIGEMRKLLVAALGLGGRT